jgi:hypothetical protein
MCFSGQAMFDGSRSRGGREEVMKEEGEGSY